MVKMNKTNLKRTLKKSIFYKKLIFSLIFVVLSLVAFGCAQPATNEAVLNKENMMDKEDMTEGHNMMENENSMMPSEYEGKILAGTIAPYLDFNKRDYDKALKENKKILLYFYASWCPVCKNEQPQTFAAFDELKDPNIIGFRVHYKDGEDNDDAKTLVKQFQIPYQHTKVIIKNGKQAFKAPDQWDKQRYLDELAKA